MADEELRLRLQREVAEADRDAERAKADRLRTEERLIEARKGRLMVVFGWGTAALTVLGVAAFSVALVERDARISAAKASHPVPAITVTCHPGEGAVWSCDFQQIRER